MKVLMVCLGNICRSPIAEGILKQKIANYDLDWIVDSAGTSGWHDGENPDLRAIAECKKHGVDISNQISRKIMVKDFENFDLILAMDRNNLRDIVSICPDQKYLENIKLAMSFEIEDDLNVPDPYYDNRFELVFKMLDRGLESLIEQVLVKH
jgi:protein-tyrosine phosphatase